MLVDMIYCCVYIRFFFTHTQTRSLYPLSLSSWISHAAARRHHGWVVHVPLHPRRRWDRHSCDPVWRANRAHGFVCLHPSMALSECCAPWYWMNTRVSLTCLVPFSFAFCLEYTCRVLWFFFTELIDEIMIDACNKKFSMNYSPQPTIFFEFHGKPIYILEA